MTEKEALIKALTTAMQPLKLKWKVAKKQTGAYDTFYPRAWPLAYVEDRIVARIECDDAYDYSRVKRGIHRPLKVFIADYRRPPENDDFYDFIWRKLKGEFATLPLAKEAALLFFTANPSVLEK